MMHELPADIAIGKLSCLLSTHVSLSLQKASEGNSPIGVSSKPVFRQLDVGLMQN